MIAAGVYFLKSIQEFVSMAQIIDAESEDQGNEVRHKVKLTERCKPFLVGDTVRVPGDEIELYVRHAQELVEKGLATAVGAAAWVKATVKKALAPIPSVERWNKPGDGREFVCKVRVGKSVWQGEAGESYGDGATLHLSEHNARLYHAAGKITLINPDRFPARDDPAKDHLTYGPNPRRAGGLVDANAR
jgi:hypothetical protein